MCTASETICFSVCFVCVRPEDAEAGLRAGRESAETEALTSLQIRQDEGEVLHGNSVLRPGNPTVNPS